MLKKNWMVFLGLILLGGALAVGGFVIGQSTRSADLAAAIAKYNQLKSRRRCPHGTAWNKHRQRSHRKPTTCSIRHVDLNSS